MKMLRTTALAFAVAAALTLPSSGLGFPLPNILDPQQIAINAAAKQLAPFIRDKAPVLLDWASVFPTVPTLPGPPFAPRGDSRISLLSQLGHSTTGIVNLPPGDYSILTRVYCTDIHRHAGTQALWLLGPLRGARANLLAAMYARASGKNLEFGSLQSLSWAMQAGMRYGELPAVQRALFYRLIPDFRGLAAGSFIDQVQGEWNTISGTIPGLPSMDATLGRMGDAGQTVLNIRYARDVIIADANSYDAMARALAPPNEGPSDTNAGPPPWSIVAPGVYERLLTPGHFGSTSEIDVRVTGSGNVAVPLTNVISYPPNHHDWQPLTQESPTIAFGPMQTSER